MQTVIELTWQNATDTLVLPAWKSLGECINAYLNACNADVIDCWELYDLDANVHVIALDRRIQDLHIPSGSHFELRPKLKATVSAPEAQPIISPQIAPARLICSIETASGSLDRIPETGLIINRAWLVQRLPRWTRWRIAVQKWVNIPSYLDTVSRHEHCRIYWDTTQLKWLLELRHPLELNNRNYQPGEQLALMPGNSVMKFSNSVIIYLQLKADL